MAALSGSNFQLAHCTTTHSMNDNDLIDEKFPSAGAAFYFAFGANMSTECLKKREITAKTIGTATLKNYVFSYSKESKDKSGKGNIHPQEGSKVEGVVFELPLAQFTQLDKFEGVAYSHYNRTSRFVILKSGQGVHALTYIAHSTKIKAGLKPTAEYVELVVSGAREHSLSEDYINTYLSVDTTS